MSKCEEKMRFREEKRAAKKLHREEKRKEKQRHREEKRELKRRHREEKRKNREDFVSKLFNLSLDSPSSSSSSSNNSNIPNIQLSPERIENEVATLRTIFPDCDPLFIRSCLANESGSDDHIRKVAEYLLTTDYPKVAPVSPLTPPTAPPLARNSFDYPNDNDAPPSYEESLGNQPLKPPPLPTRHQRAVSWNGNSNNTVISSRSTQLKPCQITQQFTQQISQQITQQITRSAASATAELNDAVGSVVKSLLTSMKPSTVDRACHKYSHIWSRPIPSHINPKTLTQQFKILPKDKSSIQKGFNQCNYPSRELKYHDISEEDWYCFMNGLNSLIGVNSKGNQGEGNSISLKWVSWMNVTMDESLMESNIKALNEYIDKWNSTYFNPRKIMVQFIDDRNQSNNPFKKSPYEQFILVKSI